MSCRRPLKRLIIKKNNLHLHRVHEGVEGQDLRQFIEEVISACLGSEAEIVVKSFFSLE